jgi:hypothetical protein
MTPQCLSIATRILVQRVSQAVSPTISPNLEILLVVRNNTTNNKIMPNNNQVCALFTLVITVTSKWVENQLLHLVVSDISRVHWLLLISKIPGGSRISRIEVQVTVFNLMSSQVKLYYDRRWFGQSILVSNTHLGPSTNFSTSFLHYFYTVTDLLMWGVISDEKSGLYFSVFAGIAVQPFSCLSPIGLMSIFYCLYFWDSI